MRIFNQLKLIIKILPLFLSLNALAESQLEQLLMSKQYDKFFAEAQLLVKENDRDALFLLGKAYSLGLGTDVDNNKAKQLYLLASDLGSARADNNLGLILFNEGKRAEGISYLEKAYERGLKEIAVQNLANLYRVMTLDIQQNGITHPYGYKRAINTFNQNLKYQALYYQQKPTLDNLEDLSRAYLYVYLYVDKTTEAEQNAVKWLDKAIAEGSVNAIFNKGVIYQAQNNNEEAKKWFKQAAEKKQPLAGQLLGNMTTGVESLMWFGNAMGVGNIKAAEKVRSKLLYSKDIPRKLSKEQLNTLKREVDSFLKIQTNYYEQKLAATKQQKNYTIYNEGTGLHDDITRYLAHYMNIVVMFEKAKEKPLKLKNEKIYFSLVVTDGFRPYANADWRITALSSHTQNPQDAYLRPALVSGVTNAKGEIILDKDYSNILGAFLAKGDVLVLTYTNAVFFLYLKPVVKEDGIYLVPNDLVNKRLF